VLVGSGCIISSRVVGIDYLSSCIKIENKEQARAISSAGDAGGSGEEPVNRQRDSALPGYERGMNMKRRKKTGHKKIYLKV
jgi:hypothetical protein